MATSCTGRDLNWILQKFPSWKRLSSTGTGCPGTWYLKDVCNLGTCFNGGLGSAGSMVGLNGLRGHFNLNDPK